MSNQPVKKFKAGAVESAIWKNEKKTGDKVTSVESVSIVRRYKDQNNKWQSTSSFSMNELPKVSLVANKAFEFLALSGSGSKGAQEDLSSFEGKDNSTHSD